MSRFNSIILVSVSLSGLIGTCVQAQEKASIPVGTFELTPTLNVSLSKDSNVTRSSDNKIDSWVTVLNPELTLGKQIGENRIVVGANASKGIYHSSGVDDYDDYQIFAEGDLEFDRRNRITGSIVHSAGHDDRGTMYSFGLGDSLSGPDQFTKNTFDATYSYGTLTSKANVDVNLLLRDIDYDIDVLEINSTRVRDRKESTIGSTFYYGISPTTDILFDASYLVTDYVDSLPAVASYDSNTQSLLVGAKWETTAATSGFAKIGYQKRDFDDINRSDYSGIKWEAGVAWNPIERSVFEFSTISDTQETNGQGNFIRRKDYVVDWKHSWLERFSTVATISYSDDSYEGGTTPRNDETKEYKAAGYYQFRRWVKFSTSVTYFDNTSDSTVLDFDYNRSLVSFAVEISL